MVPTEEVDAIEGEIINEVVATAEVQADEDTAAEATAEVPTEEATTEVQVAQGELATTGTAVPETQQTGNVFDARSGTLQQQLSARCAARHLAAVTVQLMVQHQLQ